jgi:hypothetical protein
MKNRAFNAAFFSSIHRARVTDVHIEKGTVDVLFDGVPYTREVLIPLLGLSYPPISTSSGTTETAETEEVAETESEARLRAISTSWGRYIPQKGDMLLVGFDTNGEAYSLGYHAVFYQGFQYQDSLMADRGGIGWGQDSGKNLQPGDWDFKSSRMGALYLGDKAKLSSGPHSLLLDKTSGDATLTSGLVQDVYGESSIRRKGDARRFLLPTDGNETYIFSIIPGNNTKTAQESLDAAKYSTLLGVEVELSRIHHGEVIDELTKTPMVPALNASLAPLALLTGTGVRMLHSVKDPTGTIDYYISAVDDLGNYGVSAPLATGFVWSTPLAVWQITNLNTTHTSTGTYSLTANSLSLTSTTSLALSGATLTAVGSTSVSLTAPTIDALGTVSLGATGGSPVLKADPAFAAAWSTYFTGAAAAWTALNTLMPNPAFTAAGAAATALAALCQPTTLVTAM